jgi:hypothetical protein
MKAQVGFSNVYSSEATDERNSLLSYKISDQNELPPSTMKESYSEAIIPIGIHFIWFVSMGT